MTTISTPYPQIATFREAEDAFAAGIKFYVAEKFNRAAQLFHDAARMAPSQHKTWAMRAHSLAAIGKTRSAVVSMREAVRLEPAMLTYRKALVRYLELLKAREEMVAELAGVAAHCGDDSASWLFRAEVHTSLGMFGEAGGDLKKARELRAPQADLDRVASLLREASATPELLPIDPKTRFERACANRLAAGLKGVKGTVLAGLLAPHHSSGMVDFDVVIVCDRGIFVVECKNYKGHIDGGLNTAWHAVSADANYEIKSSRGSSPVAQVEQQIFSMLKRVRTFRPASKVRVNGTVLFPDLTVLELGSVPVDRWDANAVAAFHVENLIDAIAKLPRVKDSICEDAETRQAFVEFLRK
jgi:tetratricopeptide (TPR) repeat protein